MQEQIRMVEDFHKAFGFTINQTPTWPGRKDSDLREDLMAEELQEVFDELGMLKNGNPPHRLSDLTKELADLLYVLYGTVVTLGLQDKIIPVFEAIHRNNMEKLGQDGRPIINGENGVLDTSRPIGKALKPEGWKPVDVTHIFDNQ